MLGRIKEFVKYLASHWIMTLVMIAIVVVFLAVPVMNLLAKLPGIGPWVESRRAA